MIKESVIPFSMYAFSGYHDAKSHSFYRKRYTAKIFLFPTFRNFSCKVPPYSIYACFGGSTALMISAIHEKKMLRTTHAATLRFLLCAILIFPIRQMIQMIAPTIVVIITVLLLCLFGLCVHRSLKLNAVYSF